MSKHNRETLAAMMGVAGARPMATQKDYVVSFTSTDPQDAQRHLAAIAREIESGDADDEAEALERIFAKQDLQRRGMSTNSASVTREVETIRASVARSR